MSQFSKSTSAPPLFYLASTNLHLAYPYLPLTPYTTATRFGPHYANHYARKRGTQREGEVRSRGMGGCGGWWNMLEVLHFADHPPKLRAMAGAH
ncbi:hypothetical protein Pyn_41206 [Prunus yedoensis var. nudiflora]|uniref:Uncharacterized protein n=1 Tax=Prunus yedoensis var. nudiflora TaxID=2094558 RepID=A0A314UB88_PRUYE|nr:hypothetical protein Pyn_41206 [Prunus yedoensis var. nudiflora]